MLHFLRLDALQEPVSRDFFAQALLFGSAGGAVAHGGELVSRFHVIGVDEIKEHH